MSTVAGELTVLRHLLQVVIIPPKWSPDGKIPEMIEPFRYNRFAENRLVGEKAAASVGS